MASHPPANVDKRSFIRAKQRLIHEERQKRKIEIEQLKLDRQVNEQLLKRIQQFRDEVTKHDSSVNSPDELILQLLVKNASNPAENKPAYTPPHSHGKQPPSYSQMMASLVDQIKKDVDQQKPDDRWKAFIDEFQVHFNKVTKLQKEVAEQLNKLEKEERAKITSESYHDGFSQGYVNKESEASTSSPPKKKTIATQKVAAVEQINPNADPSKALHRNDSLSSGAEADVEEVADEDDGQDASIKPSALGYEFSKIPINDYMKLAGFISRNPKVVAEREENGLLVEAFNSQIAGKEAYAKKCVHHALLLQYCRQLGANGVGIFFKR